MRVGGGSINSRRPLAAYRASSSAAESFIYIFLGFFPIFFFLPLSRSENSSDSELKCKVIKWLRLAAR